MRTARENRAIATVRLDKGYDGNGGILQVTWTRPGQTFELDGIRLVGPGLSSEKIDSLITRRRQVRYTDPKRPATAGRSGSEATAGA